ncbi:MAG: rhodanese-like domain-containing protein [Myxococcales bacterium FL481]|nr:MAG: rhodanese-like domain-containing protein [Myxococcales bacterium FL481]
MPAPPYPDRDPALARRLVEDHGALLLDVRSLDEYRAGHLDQAMHVPHNELADRIAELDARVGRDKGKPIVVYCKAGARAATAKSVLVKHGYTHVTNLGGMTDWQ